MDDNYRIAFVFVLQSPSHNRGLFRFFRASLRAVRSGFALEMPPAQKCTGEHSQPCLPCFETFTKAVVTVTYTENRYTYTENVTALCLSRELLCARCSSINVRD